MKMIFIGLVIGVLATCLWFNTGGKIHITETKTITNEVMVTITETNWIEKTLYVTITNIVSAPGIAAVDRKTINYSDIKITNYPYSNYTVKRVEPDGITFITDKGIEKFAFSDLPKEVQDKYGYDPTKAAAYRASQQRTAIEQAKQTDELQRQKKEKETAVWKENQAYVQGVEATKAAEQAAAQSNAMIKAKSHRDSQTVNRNPVTRSRLTTTKTITVNH